MKELVWSRSIVLGCHTPPVINVPFISLSCFKFRFGYPSWVPGLDDTLHHFTPSRALSAAPWRIKHTIKPYQVHTESQNYLLILHFVFRVLVHPQSIWWEWCTTLSAIPSGCKVWPMSQSSIQTVKHWDSQFEMLLIMAIKGNGEESDHFLLFTPAGQPQGCQGAEVLPIPAISLCHIWAKALTQCLLHQNFVHLQRTWKVTLRQRKLANMKIWSVSLFIESSYSHRQLLMLSFIWVHYYTAAFIENSYFHTGEN